ncbi:hypothetical protein C8D77_103398 [Mesorhizobium loti]|uniref:Uncharacterized protein n=1 Tax=Rhizobium loti TaxID=381 RepID=A0A8E2WGD8_RHILI|nr:hypothetical protein [Mesorhizobium loti]PWJ91700.1 hypothetical protein C8D77_103398 [Mesorhizobium loti]
MADLSNSRFKKAVNFATMNFAVVSATAFVVGVMTAALFTSGYLSVFGSGLIWLVQYSDLVKIGLVVTVFLLGFTWLSDSYAYMILDLFNDGVSRRRRITTGLILLGAFAAYMALQFYLDHTGGKNRIAERIIFICLVFFAVYLIVRFSRFSTDFFQANPRRIVGDLVFMLLFMTLCGGYFGQYVKNDARFKETVYLDDRILYDAVVVLFTSDYAVFCASDGAVIVVPASRIREIRGKSQI